MVMKKEYFVSQVIVGLIPLVVLGLVLGCAAVMYKPLGPVNCATEVKWDVTKGLTLPF
jgi:hypothetical protein